MAQYIKKVAVTPVRGNGFIIDSFDTNDNKHLNAPSIASVEELTDKSDNNLLYMGFLGASMAAGEVTDTGASSCGWKYQKATGNNVTCMFVPANGFNILGGAKGYLTSPMLSSYDASTQVIFDYQNMSFSLSFLFRSFTVPSGGESTPLTLAKIEGITAANKSQKIFDYEGRLKIRIVSLCEGGKLQLMVEAPNNSYGYSIPYIKLEVGEHATPLRMASPLIGIQNSISDALSQYTPFMVKSWGGEAASIQAGASNYLVGVIEQAGITDGFASKGILNVNLVYPSGGFLLTGGFNVFTDSVDGKRKARVMVYNPTQNTVYVQPQFTIFYVKST